MDGNPGEARCPNGGGVLRWYCLRARDRDRSGQRRARSVGEGEVLMEGSCSDGGGSKVETAARQRWKRDPGSAPIRLYTGTRTSTAQLRRQAVQVRRRPRLSYQDGLRQYRTTCIFRLQLCRRYRGVSCGGYYGCVFVLDTDGDIFGAMAKKGCIFGQKRVPRNDCDNEPRRPF